MTDIEDVQPFVDEQTGLAVVATTRADRTVQATVVNAGILPHPITDQKVLAFVTRGGSHKHRHLRVRPSCSLTFRRGWRWATVEGEAQLIGPDDSVAEVDAATVRLLLRDVFRAAGGTHDDWEEYDRVMAEERRVAVLLIPRRIYTS